MCSGTVLAIFICEKAGSPMVEVDAARAVPDRGLEGDRYYLKRGSLSRWPRPGRELTLIAKEDFDAMAADGVPLEPVLSRRNILLSGVPLQSLVRTRFHIGSVEVLGMQLCQPCAYLARKTGVENIVETMRGRGGLRVRILTEGIIAKGDAVTFHTDLPVEHPGR